MFVPHRHNQYRPHLIRWRGIAIVLATVGLLQFVASTTSAVSIKDASITSNDLLSETNREREKNHMSPLTVDSKLSNAAFLKARDMLRKQYWAHTAPDGKTSWQWLDDAAYHYSYAGENLAKNFQTSRAIVDAWMLSQEHRENILNSHYSQVGFGVTQGMVNDRLTNIIVAFYAAPSHDPTGVAITASPSNQSAGLLTHLMAASYSASPLFFVSVGLMLATGLTAFLTHFYRDRQLKSFRWRWTRHHGLIKAMGMISLCVYLILFHGGGQI